LQVGDGPYGRVERFERRRSRGAEGKGVEGGSRSRWKLVRMRSDVAGPVRNESGYDDGRTGGPASDGKKAVAVWADAGLYFSRVAAFEFRGSGATGELGLLWSIMAIMTCMCLSTSPSAEYRSGSVGLNRGCRIRVDRVEIAELVC
jgi:hypothetical protein